MPQPEAVHEVAAAAQAGGHYRAIDPALVERLAFQELSKGRSSKEAVKAVRSKLHQVGSAYLEKPVDYAALVTQLDALPASLHAPEVQAFCRQTMRLHTSSNERLALLDHFYAQALQSLAPIRSILDVACGFNPLALPWMPVAADVQYFACDIFSDMVGFLDHFFRHFQVAGSATVCDLSHSIPQQPAQLAFLLKTLPCLEQLDKSLSVRLLAEIPADHLLVSFPVASLGGRGKGMRQNYEAHFLELTKDWRGKIQRFEFQTELAYLLSRQ
ncbi:MAG: 16S rRNA methyltransferase [Anaerolineaceae bacterium]|jgi:16S rRNA (guanine(1405)-N(7))-methyltransferase